MEYIKVFWTHNLPDEPAIIFYEVDTQDERFAKRSIEMFRDRSTRNIPDLYTDVIEAMPIPTIGAFNSDIYGEEFHAYVITKEKFEEIWNRLYKVDGESRNI